MTSAAELPLTQTGGSGETDPAPSATDASRVSSSLQALSSLPEPAPPNIVGHPAPPDAGLPPPLTAKVGSLGVFWALIEPILTRLKPRRFCEIGVESGQFTAQLLAWARANDCAYIGIDPVIDPALSAGLRPADPSPNSYS